MTANLKNKRLLVISHSYSNFVKDQIDALAPEFLEITVLVRTNPFAEITRFFPIAALKPYSIKEKIDLTGKPPNVHVFQTPIFYLPFEFQYYQLGEKHFRIVDRIIRKNKITFDLIHAHFAWSAGYVGAQLKEKYQKKFVLTAHGFDIYDLPFQNDIWLEKIKSVLASADEIITVSQSNIKSLNTLDVRVPVKVIPNGYTQKLFYRMDKEQCRRYLNLPLDKEIILHIGNYYDEVKGHKYLVESMKLVSENRKNVICYIIGDGKLKSSLISQIQELKLENFIKLMGSKPHNELLYWLNACDIFVVPSIRESFGVTQIEAMACGVPIVATINGGSEEIITNQDIGFLVEPKKPDQMAEKILCSLEKKWDRDRIVDFSKKYSLNNLVSNICEIYTEVIGYGMN